MITAPADDTMVSPPKKAAMMKNADAADSGTGAQETTAQSTAMDVSSDTTTTATAGGGDVVAGVPSKGSIDDVPRMLAEGKKKAALSDWDTSLDLLSTAVEIMNEKYGELAPECADAYFIYGQTLLTAAVSRASALGGSRTDVTAAQDEVEQDAKILESVQGKPASHFAIEGDDEEWGVDGEEDIEAEEAEGEGGEEATPATDALPVDSQPQEGGAASSAAAAPAGDKDDMELAFEVLDMCRVIYTKMDTPEAMAKLGDVELMLGDISLDAGHYKEAIKEYAMAIALKQMVNAPHRELAEAHYKLALPLEYENQYDEAIKQVRLVVVAVEQRIQLLKQELKDAGVEVDAKGKGKVDQEETDPIKSEILEMEGVLVEMAEKVTDLMSQKAQARPGFLNAESEEAKGDASTGEKVATVVNDLSGTGLIKSKKNASISTSAPSAHTTASATKRKADGDVSVESGPDAAKKAKTDV
ncbi:hypothetical protein SmJEL517_g04908 [Synchytrium microbalum]|uniref:Tetratricopeptide SHNi-TPR domain-containing protein n=1 Tax=Synchytrium microbalum TaxID=1806994 RepID=A0A507C2Z3_9FUNG|nr:uncharacterized protein SmJEL517_g04908 [Synchytrium microbalum]TPX31883.1 hypothetical protein SmJEL517_g04908 [Synchytrium microbalum]